MCQNIRTPRCMFSVSVYTLVNEFLGFSRPCRLLFFVGGLLGGRPPLRNTLYFLFAKRLRVLTVDCPPVSFVNTQGVHVTDMAVFCIIPEQNT